MVNELSVLELMSSNFSVQTYDKMIIRGNSLTTLAVGKNLVNTT